MFLCEAIQLSALDLNCGLRKGAWWEWEQKRLAVCRPSKRKRGILHKTHSDNTFSQYAVTWRGDKTNMFIKFTWILPVCIETIVSRAFIFHNFPLCPIEILYTILCICIILCIRDLMYIRSLCCAQPNKWLFSDRFFFLGGGAFRSPRDLPNYWTLLDLRRHSISLQVNFQNILWNFIRTSPIKS